jgi:hypothetical protein
LSSGGWFGLAVRPICACVASAETIQPAKRTLRSAPLPMLFPNAVCAVATSANATTRMTTKAPPMARTTRSVSPAEGHGSHRPPGTG